MDTVVSMHAMVLSRFLVLGEKLKAAEKFINDYYKMSKTYYVLA